MDHEIYLGLQSHEERLELVEQYIQYCMEQKRLPEVKAEDLRKWAEARQKNEETTKRRA